MNLNLTQIRLLAEDFHKSMAFYKEIVELPVVYYAEEMHYVSFKAGGIKLEIIPRKDMNEIIGEVDAPVEREVPKSKFLFDFGVENVDEVYEHLKKKGVNFLNEPHDRPAWNARVCHFRDPDGNVIELYKHPL